RTDKGDRYQEKSRRPAVRHPEAVLARVRDALRDRRHHRTDHRGGHRYLCEPNVHCDRHPVVCDRYFYRRVGGCGYRRRFVPGLESCTARPDRSAESGIKKMKILGGEIYENLRMALDTL